MPVIGVPCLSVEVVDGEGDVVAVVNVLVLEERIVEVVVAGVPCRAVTVVDAELDTAAVSLRTPSIFAVGLLARRQVSTHCTNVSLPSRE